MRLKHRGDGAAAERGGQAVSDGEHAAAGSAVAIRSQRRRLALAGAGAAAAALALLATLAARRSRN